ncbi:Leucine carboxyl methyltransferase [Spironucleus salmonicida]|uniref:Leucine carboxyl methyltransferase 1 n=1 Tax=Spironucleus salmonicida TaxID=348837 RepID=V6LJ81_9EUKA|nr:Leucine carboxyl methyltransferase [Spironucleus salmonicida]|eukprot:EST44632.1 Leucine carboxyl methyltransferase [Spironucleus salmonicida]
MSYKPTAQATANDAIASKASAAYKKYFDDPMLQKVYHKNPQHKDPMINRGTWFRVRFIQQLALKFIQTHENGQIIVLGGGLDTLYFRLNEPAMKFTELDLPEIIQTKAHKLNMQKQDDGTYKYNEFYSIQSGDLEEPDILLQFQKDIPTLFISDVVVSYIESDSTIDLIKQMRQFAYYAYISFEMINPDDKFGDTMIFNMSRRETFMPTFAEVGYTGSYRARFLENECESIFCKEAWEVYKKWNGRNEMEKIEMLDEFEQFEIIMKHYGCICCGKGIDIESWIEAHFE